MNKQIHQFVILDLLHSLSLSLSIFSASYEKDTSHLYLLAQSMEVIDMLLMSITVKMVLRDNNNKTIFQWERSNMKLLVKIPSSNNIHIYKKVRNI